MDSPKNYRAFLVTLCVSMLYFCFGTTYGWTSPVMPKLRGLSDESPLLQPVNRSEEGWISSLMLIGGLSSSLISGPLAGRFGRKNMMLLSSVFFALSFLMFIFGFEVWIICLGRFVQGVGGGLMTSTLSVYIGEIATDDCRGAFGTIYPLFLILGVIYVYAIGPYVSYVTLQWCCLVVPVFFFVTFSFMPETPYYHAMKGRKSDGIKSLKFLRGQSTEACKIEMTKIQTAVDESMSNEGSIIDIFSNRGYRKALIICCGLLNLQAFSGSCAVTFNAQSIFTSAESTLDPAIASILLASVQLALSICTSLLIERTGRKVLLLISAAGMTIALFALGCFFYIKTFSDASGMLWLPVPALVFFYAAFSIGFGPIPWAVLGEIFPANIKSSASSIATANIWGMTFIITRWYPEVDALGSYYAFWGFGSICIVSIFFVHFVMIETKGMSLQEIQDKLHSSKKSCEEGTMYENVPTKLIN